MFKRAIEELGTVDILVNNAGIQSNAPVDRMTIENDALSRIRIWRIGTIMTLKDLC
jgi:NAD(P)-dependent dehydrogenase (short-subunit alcohol dehydrogenase family)